MSKRNEGRDVLNHFLLFSFAERNYNILNRLQQECNRSVFQHTTHTKAKLPCYSSNRFGLFEGWFLGQIRVGEGAEMLSCIKTIKHILKIGYYMTQYCGNITSTTYSTPNKHKLLCQMHKLYLLCPQTHWFFTYHFITLSHVFCYNRWHMQTHMVVKKHLHDCKYSWQKDKCLWSINYRIEHQDHEAQSAAMVTPVS